MRSPITPPPDATLQQLAATLASIHGVSTPLDGAASKKPPTTTQAKSHGARAAAARRPTRRAFVRWLLARTATALPTVHGRLKATQTGGVYRAQVQTPRWLRATSRVLRKGHVTTLPMDVVVGGARVRVAVPLPR
ncbi:MAG TPA: hypothetical protein VK501_06135 [Baekduia sp.]|uniref:hypothetical protein n=1 Tax=Baekduia sp. TaxID=2600305 RepID=UPI002CB51A80|nr:hypothetical protein [Baekduia sp.]HMJ33475.1 hypothetical protein [Baekduia sp.]